MSDDELLDLLRRDPEKGLKALIAKFGGLVYTVVRRNLPEAFCAAYIEACAQMFSPRRTSISKNMIPQRRV